MVYGTTRGTVPKDKNPEAQFIKIADNSECINLISDLKPTHFLNLSRGETDQDFAMHQECIKRCNKLEIRYGYASSFNACDNQLIDDHLEAEKSNAKSAYGIFKAKCEEELFSRGKKFCIFRFSATHGFASNRIARTEDFLKKLKNGEKFTVHSGLFQNRTFVGDLAGMMCDVLLDSDSQGIFHLGTYDKSEEVDFFKKMAKKFGYSGERVVIGTPTPINASIRKQAFEKVFSIRPRADFFSG